MKQKILLLAGTIALLSIFVFWIWNNPAPSGLMTEFIRQPHHTPILDEKPEFTWIVPAGYEYQEAYQILVASSLELLDKEKGDMWDSEKTESNQSVEVEYAGKRLIPGSSYFWKVRIWGSNGDKSNFSDYQEFVMGNPDAWQTTANVFLEEKDVPVRIKKPEANTLFADFGKAAFGRLSLHYTPQKKTTLIVHLGEKITGNRIDRNPGGSIRYASVNLTLLPGTSAYDITLKPDTRNTTGAAVLLPDSFGVIMPFRYVEIENCPDDLEAENILRTSYFHFFEEDESHFASSDTLLNQVWELSKYTMKATSFAGLYVDGDRERIPYEADAYINQLGHYCVDREYSMARRTNEYFMENPTWPTEWILFTIPMFMEDYYYTGNIESFAKYYSDLHHKTLVELAREDGLISSTSPAMTPGFMKKIGFSDPGTRLRDIVDWPPAQKDTQWKLATPEGERDGFEFREINTVVNALHYYNLVIMAEIAGRLKKPADADFYFQRAKQVKGSINTKLFDPVKKIYTDGEGSSHSSLHSNMFALAVGLVPGENIPSVADYIKTRGMACSVYGSQLLLDGLFMAGESNYAFDLLTATHDRSWWNMIRIGSTIALEAWDMKYKPNSDWNHAWGAAPANIIPRRLWGIRPAEPGFSSVIIQPQLNRLEWSEIRIPTIRGTISGRYEKQKNRTTFVINIPGNMQATFDPGSENYSGIRLNGENLPDDTRILTLHPGKNRILLSAPLGAP